MKTLTNSRMKAARLCFRLHLYQYILGYRPAVEADTLRFGTLIHKGLEAWWKNKGDARLLAGLEAMQGEADPFDRARAEVMLLAYDARWRDEPYEVVAVERQFATRVLNPTTGRPSQTWRLEGKIDVLVRDLRNGLIYLVEHKTSSEDISQGSEYWRRLRMDGQVSTYYEGATSLGLEVAGCIYDVLKKPAIRPLLATPLESRKFTKDGALYKAQRLNDESPDEYRARLVDAIAGDPDAHFQRGTVVRLESEMHEALFDTWQTAQAIHEAEVAGRAPRNPDACTRFGRTCQFFGVCTGEESLEDPTKFKRSDNVNPELSPAERPKEEAHS